MKATSNKNKKKTFPSERGLFYGCSSFLLDSRFSLFIEDYFHEALYMERKRAERYGKYFLLMLIDFTNAFDAGIHEELFGAVTRAINSFTRETDVKGWYKDNQVIGTVFTDVPLEKIETLKARVPGEIENHGVAMELVKSLRITFHVYPEDRWDRVQTEKKPFDTAIYPDLEKKRQADKTKMFLKRAFDVAGAVAGLIVFSPFFIAVPVLIKLTSRGPVFFRQVRAGESGREFTFLKFRSMADGNDPRIHSEYVKKLILEQKAYAAKDGGQNGAVYKIKDDPRVTWIGKFLRKTSLDELPQFLNVLRGEMSIVGPRPPIPYELENYSHWHWRRLLGTKPGITGLWQVTGRSSTSFNEMVRLDIRYIQNWSLLRDIKLVFLTPLTMLSSKGGY